MKFSYPPDQYARMQIIMANDAIRAFVDGKDVETQLYVQTIISTALAVDPLTKYIAELDSFKEYQKQRSKHLPVTTGKWASITSNFNSANDEEIKR